MFNAYSRKKQTKPVDKKELHEFQTHKLLQLLEQEEKPVKMVPFMHKHYWAFKFSNKSKNIGSFRKFLAIMMKKGLVKKTIIDGYSYIALAKYSLQPTDPQIGSPQKEIGEKKGLLQKQESPHSKIAPEFVPFHTFQSQPVAGKDDHTSSDMVEEKPATPATVRTGPRKAVRERVQAAKPTVTRRKRAPVSLNKATDKPEKALLSRENSPQIEIKFLLFDHLFTLEAQMIEHDLSFQDIVEQKTALRLQLNELQKEIYRAVDSNL